MTRARGAASSSLERADLTRLAAFAGLCALAAWRYAGVEVRPPTFRVLALVAVAVVAGAVLMRTRHAAGRVIVMATALAVALLAAGVPARLLLPPEWGTLVHRVRGGLNTVASTLWPYPGDNSWARLDILMATVLFPLAAAAVGFWPQRPGNVDGALSHGIRRLCALVLLLTLYVIGVLDSDGGSTTVEGLLLTALVAGWLWLPGLRARRALAALPWLAVAGALAAVLVPSLAGSRAWLDYRAWNLLGAGQQGTAFSWDQTYGPIPWSRSQSVMFTVRAPGPQLWKVTTLDRFDGLRFVRSGTDGPSEEDLPLPVSWYTFATFTIKGLSSEVLPTEGGSIIGLNFGDPVHRDQDGTARTLGIPVRSGDTYTVLSYVPQPTPKELRASPSRFPAAYLRYTAFDLPAPSQSGLRLAGTDPLRPGHFFTGRSLAAPAPGLAPAALPSARRRILASPYGPMYRLARRLASGSRSGYDVAVAIERYLKTNYNYTERPPARRYPLESFLFADHGGYCQQFSGAMALMLRMDGIPARVAAGFLPGAYDSAAGTFEVRAIDAHSWVEVYFTGIGWVPFDPTPPRPAAAVQRLPVFPSERTANALDAIAATVGSLPQDSGQRIPTARRGPTTDSATALEVASITAAVAALLALVIRWLAGRTRLRRSLADDGELAVMELVQALRRLGYAVPATVTLAQIERLVRLHGGPDAAHYVRLLRDRRYGDGHGEPATLLARRRLRHGLTAPLGLDARLRGMWAIPPGTIGWRIRPSG